MLIDDPSGYFEFGNGFDENSKSIVRNWTNKWKTKIQGYQKGCTPKENEVLELMSTVLTEGNNPIVDWHTFTIKVNYLGKEIYAKPRGYTHNSEWVEIQDELGKSPGDKFKETFIHELFHAATPNPFPRGHNFGPPNKAEHNPFESDPRNPYYRAIDLWNNSDLYSGHPKHTLFAPTFTDWFLDNFDK